MPDGAQYGSGGKNQQNYIVNCDCKERLKDVPESEE